MKYEKMRSIGAMETIADLDSRGALWGFEHYGAIDAEHCDRYDDDDAEARAALIDCGLWEDGRRRRRDK